MKVERQQQRVVDVESTSKIVIECPVRGCKVAYGFIDTLATRAEPALFVYRRRVRYLRLVHEAGAHDK